MIIQIADRVLRLAKAQRGVLAVLASEQARQRIEVSGHHDHLVDRDLIHKRVGHHTQHTGPCLDSFTHGSWSICPGDTYTNLSCSHDYTRIWTPDRILW